jgi:hypothetical protein
VAIHEPTTLITDYVLGGLTGFLAWRMVKVQPSRATQLWAAALAAVAAASFAGGTHHGFGPSLTASSAAALWKVTTMAMGIASFLLSASAVSASFSGAGRRALLAATAIKLAIYIWWMSTHDAFIYVMYDYGSTLVFVLALLAVNRVRGEAGHRIYLAGGILGSIVAALLQQSGIRLHAHFNHNDLMHVVQMGAVWLLYEGGRRLQDENGRG